MNPWVPLLIVVSLLSFTGGQLLIKKAVVEDGDASTPDHTPPARPPVPRARILAAGIVSMTISFFVNLGLLQHLDLSFLFPFQGLSVLIVTFGASLFLRERLTVPLIVGTLLITVGVMLVSTS